MQDVTPKPGEHLITVITASGATMGKLSIIADCNQGGTWQRCELQGHGNGMYFGDPSINLNGNGQIVGDYATGKSSFKFKDLF